MRSQMEKVINPKWVNLQQIHTDREFIFLGAWIKIEKSDRPCSNCACFKLCQSMFCGGSLMDTSYS